MYDSFKSLKVGDTLTIDGIEFEVNSKHIDFMWLREIANSHYYSLRSMYEKEYDDLRRENRLIHGRAKSIGGGNIKCFHTWIRYIGAREVYDYCECGAKRKIDWKEIGDGPARKS